MRIFRNVLLMALLVLPGVLWAAPPEVLVVFNGNTEANRHVFSGLSQVLSKPAAGGYKVVATLNTASVKPGTYKAIIVVSSRATSGVEPTLEAFIKGYAAPEEIYLVTLLSRKNSYSVTGFTKDSSPLGVDGVSAATAWNNNSKQMHSQWMQLLAKALAAR